jgi:hypothetical protein
MHSRLNAFHAVCLAYNVARQHPTPSVVAMLERHILFPVSTKTGKVTRRIESYSSTSSLDADAVQAKVLDFNKELQRCSIRGESILAYRGMRA